MKRGFTLIELLTVICIIAIVSILLINIVGQFKPDSTEFTGEIEDVKVIRCYIDNKVVGGYSTLYFYVGTNKGTFFTTQELFGQIEEGKEYDIYLKRGKIISINQLSIEQIN